MKTKPLTAQARTLVAQEAILSALDSALFGAGWDADVCAQRLALRAASTHDAPLRSHHLVCAIGALADAKAALASAERSAAKLVKGGAL